MNDDNGVIGFCSFITKEGTRRYGCRGMGKVYQYFYDNFIVGKSYKSTSEDWPWDYFVFEDIKDEQKFLNKYSKDIYYDIGE